MLSIWTVGAIVVAYLTMLFIVAFLGDKYLKANQQHPFLYSLGLGVHCTSWAFFGTTTQAVQFGWAVVPTYAGIILVMMFMFPVLLRINRLCQQHNISSLADFIALRYQRSHLIAAFITVMCFVGVIPYIALQLDAITKSINLLAPDARQGLNTVGIYVAALMALFAILFGTRSLSLKEKHPGLLLTIALESILKLVGLSIVGLFACYVLFNGPLDLIAQAAEHPASREVLYADNAPWVYLGHVLLGVCSMFVLPRQFHMNFVESNGDGELRTARWLFPLYLLSMTVFILPLALAGQMLLDTTAISSDEFVLALPLSQSNLPVSLAAFIGGLSATTSMIIVATLALGIMIANNLITPLWLTIRLKNRSVSTMKANGILTIRRITVLVVLSVAYWYHLNVSQSAPLVKSGIIAIALLGQMLPAMLLGMYWRRSTVTGACMAMLAGFAGWLAWVLYPSLLSSYYFEPAPSDSQLAGGFALSLMVNIGTFLLISVLTSSRHALRYEEPPKTPALMIRVANLMQLTQRVLEPAEQQQLSEQLSVKGATGAGYASAGLLKKVEQLLANQVGTPGARVLLSALAESRHSELPDLVDWVEEASMSFQFNHEVLQSSVQHIHQGISVLDQQLCLLAWNKRYEALFEYPADVLETGMHIEQLLRYNAKRGLLGDSKNVENEIAKRITFMQEGTRYKYIRRQPDGKVIELNGSPLPGGGYVTTYSDITEYIQIQEALEDSKLALEDRVRQRTEELQQARNDAERANESKTRFLAAAGHDLMQPFNAATLFSSLLSQRTAGTPLEELSQGVVSSLNSAETLLSMLLDMTKLESGAMIPEVSCFALDDVLAPLVQEFSVIASQKGLKLNYPRTSVYVHSDKRLLRRIVQNLVSNAIRYTEAGTVLIGVRRGSNGTVSIWVCDTGTGIAPEKQQEVFTEFHQLDAGENNPGLGLGLTIVDRISQLLAHAIHLDSAPGKGTRFTVTLPRASRPVNPAPLPVTTDNAVSGTEQFLAGKSVLIIENDPDVAKAMTLTLRQWGAETLLADDLASAIAVCPAAPSLMVVDYHLNRQQKGTCVAKQLRENWQHHVPGILNTAKRDENIKEVAANEQLYYLPKPVKSLALKRAIKQLVN
ncbi:PAS domain-containing hybrid sensor histidine kinase/response regulator [Salinimonas iocasae]|uniref:histidine kinase n=1 Tax=Salinimonas iocasae TaxID=2572577 RepID=A0A5B7YEI3_9ALTE|nr:PAS-domain containing protein [Salinimonas iocasae]QCZ93965.1 hybrid sensor histidine kinase/response regulator [Salinimonas iocasae]